MIYKIRPGLIKRKIAKITHIVTRNDQFGRKEGISTTDAIAEIEKYTNPTGSNSKVLPINRASALGTIKRAILGTTLYNKALPTEMINHIRRGRRNTKNQPRYNAKYGNMP